MKLDKRDIVAQQDYTPLSNAELLAHIETYAGLIYDMPLAERGRWQDEILGPARVLLERIEAAEALAYERLEAALFAEQRATDAELFLSEIVETATALKARIAELEAARRFKRGYPDKPGMYIVRRADGTVGTARYYTDGWNWGAFNTDITRWAEMPEEPTP